MARRLSSNSRPLSHVPGVSTTQISVAARTAGPEASRRASGRTGASRASRVATREAHDSVTDARERFAANASRPRRELPVALLPLPVWPTRTSVRRRGQLPPRTSGMTAGAVGDAAGAASESATPEGGATRRRRRRGACRARTRGRRRRVRRAPRTPTAAADAREAVAPADRARARRPRARDSSRAAGFNTARRTKILGGDERFFSAFDRRALVHLRRTPPARVPPTHAAAVRASPSARARSSRAALDARRPRVPPRPSPPSGRPREETRDISISPPFGSRERFHPLGARPRRARVAPPSRLSRAFRCLPR